MVINQSFSFGIRLLLAKILFPEQFGLVGMATVFTGFVQVLNELGMGAALVQRKKEELKAIHFNTAFWTGVGWSIFLFAVMSLLVAPFAANFYNEPMLRSLIPVISIGILLSPINLVNKAQLMKSMDFKPIAKAENIANIAAGIISLILAFAGAGVWSLAFNSIGIGLFAIPFYFKATGWFPQLKWEKGAFKDIFGFGVYTTGTNMVNYCISNVDYLLIGKLVSAQALGIYTFAFLLTDGIKSKISSIVSNVMYPLYATMQDDPLGAKKIFIKVVEYNCIVVYPIMLFLIILGNPFIISIFGDKWAEAIFPTQLLAIAVMVQMLVNSNTVLIRGMGRPDFELKLQLFKSLIYIPILWLGIQNYGIIGASWAVLINRVIAVLITNYTFRIFNIKISIKDFFLMTRVPVFAAAISGLSCFVIYYYLQLHFILGGLFLISCYGGIIFFLKKEEIKLIIKDLKAKKSKSIA